MLGVISLFGYLNHWNDSMGTTIETGAIESAEIYLGKHNWEIEKHVKLSLLCQTAIVFEYFRQVLIQLLVPIDWAINQNNYH